MRTLQDSFAMKESILVIIPAFNEERSIGKVIDDIPKEFVSEVVVVNNGSTDGTNEEALRSGATVLYEPRKGYGYTCLKGIKYARSKPLHEQPGIIVFLDGDYSDFPQEMVKLVKAIQEGYDMVIGSRTIGKRERGSMLPQARFGNALATKLIFWLYKAKFSDLGPFRAIRFNKLLTLGMEDTTFGWTVEMQIKAAKNGLKYTEIPVSYCRRIGASKIAGTTKGTIMAGHKILWTLFKLL